MLKQNKSLKDSYKRRWYLKNKDKHRKIMQDYYKSHRQEIIQKTSEDRQLRMQKLRTQILKLLGNSCSRCGFSDKRALQIDHVKSNGNEEKERYRGRTEAYYRNILLKIQENSKDYQLLCANCNVLKMFEKNEFRGRKNRD